MALFGSDWNNHFDDEETNLTITKDDIEFVKEDNIFNYFQTENENNIVEEYESHIQHFG